MDFPAPKRSGCYGVCRGNICLESLQCALWETIFKSAGIFKMLQNTVARVSRLEWIINQMVTREKFLLVMTLESWKIFPRDIHMSPSASKGFIWCSLCEPSVQPNVSITVLWVFNSSLCFGFSCFYEFLIVYIYNVLFKCEWHWLGRKMTYIFVNNKKRDEPRF